MLVTKDIIAKMKHIVMIATRLVFFFAISFVLKNHGLPGKTR